MPYFLNVSLGADNSYSFSCVPFSKIALPIVNLHVAVCSFDEYAMNLDHSIGHNSFKSREKTLIIVNVRNDKDKR